MRSSAAQACSVVPFPLNRRAGKVRDVARKMLDKQTVRATEYYRNQVTDALIGQFNRAGIAEIEQDEQLGAFWQAVQHEMIRLTYNGYGCGGAA